MDIRKDTILEFGKWRGYSIEEILQKQPSYLKWCEENINDFKVSVSLHSKINFMIRSTNRCQKYFEEENDMNYRDFCLGMQY